MTTVEQQRILGAPLRDRIRIAERLGSVLVCPFWLNDFGHLQNKTGHHPQGQEPLKITVHGPR